MNTQNRTYNSIDLLKFTLSFLIVALHFDPTGGYWSKQPIFMLPVPLFFIISGFFFFRRPSLDSRKLLRFVSRNLTLYAAYFLLFLPYYAISWWNAWFSKDFLFGLKTLLLKFVFGSTFVASWYLMALIIGVAAVYCLSKTKIKWLPLAIGSILLAICILRTCYGNLIDSDSLFHKVIDLYPGTFYQGFPVALFWVALGKWMADHEEHLLRISGTKKVFGIVISIFLFAAEYIIISLTGIFHTRGYCVMMIPLCMAIFIAVLGMDLKFKNSKLLREISTVMYCSHATIGSILTILLGKIGLTEQFPWSLLLYVMIVTLCIIGTLFILKLEQVKYFKWCKFFK